MLYNLRTPSDVLFIGTLSECQREYWKRMETVNDNSFICKAEIDEIEKAVLGKHYSNLKIVSLVSASRPAV